MRKTSHVFLLLFAILLTGCVPWTNPTSQPNDLSSAVADYESATWRVISIDPNDYDIPTIQNHLLEGYDPNELTLAELCAYCQVADGAGGELSCDLLYTRFMEAPNTVLNFLAMANCAGTQDASIKQQDAVDFLCRRLALANVHWYEAENEFQEILNEYEAVYPSGRIHDILSSLKRHFDIAVEDKLYISSEATG